MDSTFNEVQILTRARLMLSSLLEAKEKADKESAIRDNEIAKAKAVIDLFSGATEVKQNREQLQKDTEYLPSIGIAFSYGGAKTWKDKIKAFLKFKNKVCTVAEMYEAFLPLEKGRTEQNLLSALSSSAAVMLKKHMLKVYTPKIKMKGFTMAIRCGLKGKP